MFRNDLINYFPWAQPDQEYPDKVGDLLRRGGDGDATDCLSPATRIPAIDTKNAGQDTEKLKPTDELCE